MTEHKSIEEIAKLFHETYERLAPQYGYETRADTKEFDKDSPNGKLMIAVIAELIPHLNSRNLIGVENETKNKLLASINSFLAEQGIKDTDGTPLTFSPERF